MLAVQYGYDAQGHLDSMIYPDGTILSYNHDAAGRINGADVTLSGGSPQSLIQNIAYLPFGPISQFDYAGAYPDQESLGSRLALPYFLQKIPSIESSIPWLESTLSSKIFTFIDDAMSMHHVSGDILSKTGQRLA